MSGESDPRHERETIIGYDESPDEAHVYTCNAALMRRIEAQGIVAYREHRNDGKVYAKEYRVPKRWVKIAPPRKVSEAQREQQRQRMLARMAAEVE